MKRYVVLSILLLSVFSRAQVWFKVGIVGDTITSATAATYQVGLGTCWSPPFKGIMTRFPTTFGNLSNVFKVTDPCTVAGPEEIDVQQTSTQQFFIVNNYVVVVPAITDTPPIPVIFNGIKYSCSSITLDNTGILTLTCK